MLEYERSLSLRDLRARVSSTHNLGAQRAHTHTRTRTYAPINVHHGCVHTLRAVALVCLMVRAGRIILRNNVCLSCTNPHESGRTHRGSERCNDFRTVIIGIKSQLQLRMTKFSPANLALFPLHAITPTHILLLHPPLQSLKYLHVKITNGRDKIIKLITDLCELFFNDAKKPKYQKEL